MRRRGSTIRYSTQRQRVRRVQPSFSPGLSPPMFIRRKPLKQSSRLYYRKPRRLFPRRLILLAGIFSAVLLLYRYAGPISAYFYRPEIAGPSLSFTFPEPQFELAPLRILQDVGELIPSPTAESREHVVVGGIDSSFARAAQQAGLSYAVIDELVDLFSDRVLFREDFRVGDRFTVIYDQPYPWDGDSLDGGKILATALDVKGKRLMVIRYVGADGKARYFSEAKEPLGSSFLRYPVKFSRITSAFSKARFHPVLRRMRPHNGVDFAAPTGTPVRSVADGRVLFAGRDGGNGIMVKLRHSERYSTAYLHLSRIEKGVTSGTRISRGQVIGAVGSTGLATGPHLHYSLYDRGKYVDPLTTKLPMMELLAKGTKISDRYFQRVADSLNRYQEMDLSIFQQQLGG